MARNKKHKQRFNSKSAIRDKTSGRVVREGGGSGAKPGMSIVIPRQQSVKLNKGGAPAGDKERRKQAAVALRKAKNDHIKAEHTIGSLSGPPRILALVPGNESANVEAVFQSLQRYHEEEEIGSPGVPVTMTCHKLRKHATVVCETEGNEQNILDCAKVADIVVIVLDVSSNVQSAIHDVTMEMQSEEGSQATWFGTIGLCITDQTRDIVASLKAQGVPTVLVALHGLDTYDNPRKAQRSLKIHTRYFESVLPPEHKVIPITTDADVETFMRTAHTCKLRHLPWREIRPYFIAEAADYDAEAGAMQISGYLRGAGMNASQLLHLTNFGTFQIEKILVDEEVADESTPETRESLEQVQRSATVEDDQMATEEDVRQAQLEHQRLMQQEQQQALAGGGVAGKRVRVPEGVSEYQAAWYENEDVVDDLYEQDEQQQAQQQIAMARNPAHVQDDVMSFRTAQTEVDFLKPTDILRHEKMTDEERLAELQALKEASGEELDSPDVVDTPIDIPARVRFSKYRGMKSFNHGMWNSNENLPIHYGFIFKMQGYQNVRKMAIERETAVDVGAFVTVQICGVDAKVWDAMSQVLVCSAQLEHEQKFSLLHFQVSRATEFDEPIKSKTPMLAHIGFRKFYVAPLFSENGVGDRAKFCRYFHETDKFLVASFYGPISYHPTPILMFKTVSQEEAAEGAPLRLACYGAAMPPNPDRMIIKRAVLTGRVHVIHKKQIVVKFMFFNDDDVRYFQPVDIYTRFGRRGKITKAVGSHGLFKAQLNDMVMQHDIIMMDLYKRVFPKWTTVPFALHELEGGDAGSGSEEGADVE